MNLEFAAVLQLLGQRGRHSGRALISGSEASVRGQAAVEIYIVRPDGSRLRRLRKEPKGSFSFEPVWSPGAGRIAFVHGAAAGRARLQAGLPA